MGDAFLHSLLYADDVVLVADTVEDLQKMIDVVGEFCEKWRMAVNVGKSKAMVITPPKRRGGPQSSKYWRWSYNGRPLEAVSEYPYLGLTITPDLSWDTHFESLVDECKGRNARMGHILANRRVPLKIKLMLWKAKVAAKLDYGAEITVPSAKWKKKVESIQHSMGVAALGVNSKTHRLAVRRALGVQSVETRRMVRMLRFQARLSCMDLARWPCHARQNSIEPAHMARGSVEFSMAAVLNSDDAQRHSLPSTGAPELALQHPCPNFRVGMETRA